MKDKVSLMIIYRKGRLKRGGLCNRWGAVDGVKSINVHFCGPPEARMLIYFNM